MQVNCPVSLGELIDKISILLVKERNISDGDKLAEIAKERGLLEGVLEQAGVNNSEKYRKKLEEINSKLWEIEDAIRLKERDGQFDQDFIELARAVYFTNDQRFEVKSEINEIYGSSIKEVKSYQKYQ